MPRTPDRDAPKVETTALDGFLSPAEDSVRALTPDESYERFRDLCRPSSAGAEDPVLLPHLVLACWRWCRAASLALGRVGEDETLEDALAGIEPDPWLRALRPRLTPTERALVRQDSTSALFDAASLPEGLPLLPPTDPARAKVWCATFEVVAHDLRMTRAARGPDVLRVLCDPALAGRAPVRPAQVLELEELIVDEAQTVVVRHGDRAVLEHFSDRYGLTRRECLGLARLARADALKYGKSSVEEDRALMVAVLKGYLARARETMNMGDEIRALRELARVQGLTRTEPEDRAAEFLGVVRRVEGRRDALRLAPAAAEALGADPDEVEEALADDGDLPTDADFRLTEGSALERFDSAERAG